MFDPFDNSHRIAVVKFLLLALVLSPALLILPLPAGSFSLVLSMLGGTLCLAMMWFQRTRPARVKRP